MKQRYLGHVRHVSEGTINTFPRAMINRSLREIIGTEYGHMSLYLKGIDNLDSRGLVHDVLPMKTAICL